MNENIILISSKAGTNVDRTMADSLNIIKIETLLYRVSKNHGYAWINDKDGEISGKMTPTKVL